MREPSRLSNWLKRTEFPKFIDATTTDSAASTSHTVNLPSPSAGQLLVVAIRTSGTATITFSGYTQLLQVAATDQIACFYKISDGTEGAGDSLTTSASVRIAAVALRFSGAGVPELAGLNRSITTANPPWDPIHTGFGVKDYCFLVVATCEDTATSFTAPSGYSGGSLLIGGGSGSGRASVGWSFKFARASRDAPGTGTWGAGSRVSYNFGLAIPPG